MSFAMREQIKCKEDLLNWRAIKHCSGFAWEAMELCCLLIFKRKQQLLWAAQTPGVPSWGERTEPGRPPDPGDDSFWSREVEGNDPLCLLGVGTSCLRLSLCWCSLKQAFKRVFFIPESELPRWLLKKKQIPETHADLLNLKGPLVGPF